MSSVRLDQYINNWSFRNTRYCKLLLPLCQAELRLDENEVLLFLLLLLVLWLNSLWIPVLSSWNRLWKNSIVVSDSSIKFFVFSNSFLWPSSKVYCIRFLSSSTSSYQLSRHLYNLDIPSAVRKYRYSGSVAVSQSKIKGRKIVLWQS